MTITHAPPALLLFLSRQELSPLTPEGLTAEQARSLTYDALIQDSRPLPPAVEVHAFPSREGVLLVVFPSLPRDLPAPHPTFFLS